MSNPDLSVCPGDCFRPVGLAFDSAERMFMSSDSTGEIWVLVKTSASTTTSGGGGNPTATGAGAGGATPSPSQTGNAALRLESQVGGAGLVGLLMGVWAFV